jgi:hypothetical protein
MSWFVSDVTPSDFAQTISILQSNQWSIGDQALKVLTERSLWRLDSGVFALSLPLDTTLGKQDPASGRLCLPRWHIHHRHYIAIIV